MKIKHLFLGALALAATVVGCKPQEINGSKLEVNPAVVEAAAEQSDYTLTVEADCKWAATTSVEWLAVTPAEGTGNATVTVSVLANSGAAREATVHFQKFDTRKVSCDVTVKQESGADFKPGDGTVESPYLASQAAAICAELANEAMTPSEVYVKGYVKKFASKHEDGINSFGNALFYITDDAEGTVTPDFYCYQVYYLQGTKFTSLDQIKLGDEVVVYGKLTNYNGTYETVGKGAAYCYSINGQTEPGPGPEPTEVIDATVAEFIAAEVSTTQYYRISGEVSGNINLTYGNFDVVDETGSVYVYGLDNIAEVKDKLVAGAKITVTGTRGDYNGKVEMMNGHCEKIEEGDAPGEVINATVAEFNAAPVGNQQYRLTGKVSADAAINTSYGNFDLVDATGSVYVYGLSNIADVKEKLLPNADITIVGTRGEYNGKIEVMNATCESIEGGDEPEPSEGTVYNATDFTWSEKTHATYGQGYQGVKTGAPTLGYYKHTSTSNPVAQSGDHIRIYKSSAFTVSSETEFTKLVMTVTETKYAVGATVLVGGGAVSADNAKLTVTWEGPATKELVLHATEGQIRASKFEFVFGEGGEGGDEGEHYTLDQVNAMDCYMYEYGDGRYVCDADLYVADVANNTYSHNLDIYVPLIINEKNKIAGNHTMSIDPDYYEYYGYTTNEGVYSPFTQGTINISYVSQGVDSEGDKVYFYNVVIAAKLQNGQDFNLTVNNCRVYAVDVDDEEWPYIDLADGTKAGMSGKAVKTVKATRQIVKRK